MICSSDLVHRLIYFLDWSKILQYMHSLRSVSCPVARIFMFHLFTPFYFSLAVFICLVITWDIHVISLQAFLCILVLVRSSYASFLWGSYTIRVHPGDSHWAGVAISLSVLTDSCKTSIRKMSENPLYCSWFTMFSAVRQFWVLSTVIDSNGISPISSWWHDYFLHSCCWYCDILWHFSSNAVVSFLVIPHQPYYMMENSYPTGRWKWWGRPWVLRAIFPSITRIFFVNFNESDRVEQ